MSPWRTDWHFARLECWKIRTGKNRPLFLLAPVSPFLEPEAPCFMLKAAKPRKNPVCKVKSPAPQK